MTKRRQQELFYIYKFSSLEILSSNNHITTNFQKAKQNANIVSIGDNQILMQIRKIKNETYNPQIIYNLYKQRQELKLNNQDNVNLEEINKIQEKINNLLFCDDLINVKIEKKNHYNLLIKKGIYINGILYKRLSCGAGQTRRNSPTFVKESLYDALNKRLLCGLDCKNSKNVKRFNEISIAKFNAYYGLYSSSINVIDTPRICVVKDNFITLKEQQVYWIEQNKISNKHEISLQNKDLEMNTHDGMGLVDPQFSLQMTEKLGLDWHISNWVIRAPFIKGLVIPFDFRKFAKEVAYTNIIKDKWGIEHNINDIDMILTESQFKMHKYYENIEDYMNYFHKYEHCFGVCRYNKREDNEYSLLNYQYIQSLNLTKENIGKLIEPTVDYIKKVCSGDLLYTLHFLLGTRKEDSDILDIENSIQANFAKAILYDDRVLEDSFIKRKIYSFIEKQIKLAKLGRVMARGNYQFMIGDPYALCESVFGMDVKGLLSKGEVFSRWWTDRDVNKIDLCRSPLVCQEEHNIMEIWEDNKCNKWYEYIQSGIIYNIWDCSSILHSDSDLDGDTVFSTNNEIIINSVISNVIPITYEKQSAPNKRLSYSNMIKSDIAGFDSKVGVITNYSTAFFSMLSLYKEDSKEYEELINRIRLLRLYIGNSIDCAKGCKYYPIPKEWKTFQKILETDTEEQKQHKYFMNKLRAKSKPYFMRYLYKDTHENYEDCKNRFEYIANSEFGCSMKEILEKKQRTKEENKFVYLFNSNIGVINSNCIMNNLCKNLEDIDFDFKYLRNNKNFDYKIYQSKNVDQCSDCYKSVSEIINKYSKISSNKLKFKPDNMSYKEIAENNDYIKDNMIEFCESELYNLNFTKQEIFNSVVEYAYTKNNVFGLNLLWTKFGNIIIDKLKQNNQIVRIPVLCDKNKEDEELEIFETINIFGIDIKLQDVFNWQNNGG